MEEEICALEKNKTCDIVDLPRHEEHVGCKWVFIVKLKPDGSVNKYKTKLVAKGYTQTYRVDHQEMFAPITKMNSICVLLSLVANWN